MKCHTNINSTRFTQLPHKFSYIVAILGHNHFELPNRTTGSFNRRRGQGAKRKTPAREDHYIELQALRKRFVTSRELKNDLRLATGK
jgi:hypothetical protein